MKTRTTVQLLVLVCVLGLMAVLLPERTTRTERRRRLIPDVTPDDISHVVIVRSNLAVECVRHSDGWMMTKPLKTRVDMGVMNAVLDGLRALHKEEVITVEQRQRRNLSLDDYSLGAMPLATVTIGNADTKTTIRIGRDSPVEDLLYVKLGSDEDVVATDRSIRAIIPSRVEELRDRQIVRGDMASVSRLEIRREGKGFIRALKSGGNWVMEQPIRNARLHNWTVRGLLQVLQGLRAKEFVDGAKEVLSEKEAGTTVTIWLGDGGAKTTLLIDDRLPVKTDVRVRIAGDEQLYVVDASSVEAFAVTPNDLRHRTIFPVPLSSIARVKLQHGERAVVLSKEGKKGWFIQEPRQWKADDEIVEALLDHVTSLQVMEFVSDAVTNRAQYGLKRSGSSIEVSSVTTAGEAMKPTTMTRVLEIGARNEAGGIYVGFRDLTNSVLLTMEKALTEMMRGRYSMTEVPLGSPEDRTQGDGKDLDLWMNPLLYRSRIVLRISPASVSSISLKLGQRQQTVRRDAAGRWQAEDSVESGVEDAVINDILSAFSALKAKRIVHRNTEKLDLFGLDAPGIKITLGFTEGKGIRKSLSMGFLAQDGIYSLIQGQDMVFVLPRGTFHKLVQELTRGVGNALGK